MTPLLRSEGLKQFQYQTETKIVGSSFSRGRGTKLYTPKYPVTIKGASDHLLERPNDKLMAYHLRELIKEKGEEGIREAAALFKATPHAGLFGALAMIKDSDLAFKSVVTVGAERIMELFQEHPLRDVRIMLLGDLYQMLGHWNRAFAQNRDEFIEFDAMPKLTMAFPEEFLREIDRKYVGVDQIATPSTVGVSYDLGTSLRSVPIMETYARMEALIEKVLGDRPLLCIKSGGAYIAMSTWIQELAINLGRHNHVISGSFSSSGKGFTGETTVASCAMEMAERYSAAEGSTENWPDGYKTDVDLRHGRASELRAQGLNPLDLQGFNTLIPYNDQEIYWAKGEQLNSAGRTKVYVPAQIVFEYSFLDEPEVLFAGSNGLASGNTLEEAKLHATLEIIERDGDNSMFYAANRCFALQAEGSIASPLLAAYAARGFNLEFLDLTTEFGVPTYRAFLKFGNTVISGSGAHLDGKIAALRAIGELHSKIYVYDKNAQSRGALLPPSNPKVSNRVMGFNELLNYSTGNVQADLSIVEALLIANGLSVSYVDLTRKDIDIPVVRAIVPGLDYPEDVTKRQVQHFVQLLGPKLHLYTKKTAG